MKNANAVCLYDSETFFSLCKGIAIAAMILPDVPYEKKEEFLSLCESYGAGLVLIIAPTSKNRIAMSAKEAKDFIYLVSGLVVIGTRSEIKTDLSYIIRAVREVTDVPCTIDFKIATTEQAKQMTDISDGIIVESTIIEIIERYGTSSSYYVEEYMKGMIEAIGCLMGSKEVGHKTDGKQQSKGYKYAGITN